MVVCTAAIPSGPNSVVAAKTRYQVLPTDGSKDGWPKVIGRALFSMFGAADPAIAHVNFSNDDQHDQIPDELIECWATVFWCLQACLSAPLTKGESGTLARHLKSVIERAYAMWGALDVALGEPVVTVMDQLSARYCPRMGLSADRIKQGHERAARELIVGVHSLGYASQAKSQKN
jgi:hypothetical protein